VETFVRVGERVVAYEEFGNPHGPPVVLFHGLPGSRLFLPGPTDAARIITFDRPGYGESTACDGRTVLTTAADVEALLDHLRLDTCSLLGWSGGGPFAVATAYRLGARVRRLAIVSAPGPLDEVPGGWDALGDYQRPTAEMARKDPSRSTRAIARHMGPIKADPASFVGGDAVRNGPAGEMLVAQVHEALRPGFDGVAGDLVAMWCDWGFRLRDVTTRADVFHGALDEHNHADAACYAKQLPNAQLTSWPESGHLGIVDHWDDVVAVAIR
jgi:pimeloyl-ACP methyl ester carboxylesterase